MANFLEYDQFFSQLLYNNNLVRNINQSNKQKLKIRLINSNFIILKIYILDAQTIIWVDRLNHFKRYRIMKMLTENDKLSHCKCEILQKPNHFPKMKTSCLKAHWAPF
ncbi:hypothetical protein M153_2460007537 [Pseudoloma neurophilia]|uniref:Uncharacterized protein n=1 Tax=Pseudoloma neurophilia TaxID=146866 RepID=A0A0R0M4X1_9MICR|nr:hypothetical protein M153_2460007537 [Pseudoloma neurophilia]